MSLAILKFYEIQQIILRSFLLIYECFDGTKITFFKYSKGISSSSRSISHFFSQWSANLWEKRKCVNWFCTFRKKRGRWKFFSLKCAQSKWPALKKVQLSRPLAYKLRVVLDSLSVLMYHRYKHGRGKWNLLDKLRQNSHKDGASLAIVWKKTFSFESVIRIQAILWMVSAPSFATFW